MKKKRVYKKNKKVKKKRALSPVISTILLTSTVVVMATIILLWSQKFVQEAILKEIDGNRLNVKQLCGEVQDNLQPILESDGSFGVRNIGNIPVYSLDLKLTDRDGNSKILKLDKFESSVNPGYSRIVESYNYYDVSGDLAYEEVKIIPVLLGETKNGEKRIFECPEINGIVI